MKADKANQIQLGCVSSLRLHVYAEPTQDSEIVCKLRYLTEVEIDHSKSTDEYYKICTAIGAEGFCQKEFVTIK